jgi:hypothetical protein
VALLYIQPIGCHQRIYQLNLWFCLFSLLCCHHSLIHLERRRSPANGRAGLRNLSPLGSCTGRGRIRFLGSARCDCSTIFITARPSSKSSDAARCLRHYLQDRLRPVEAIRLPEGQGSVCTLLFDPLLNHVF